MPDCGKSQNELLPLKIDMAVREFWLRRRLRLA